MEYFSAPAPRPEQTPDQGAFAQAIGRRFSGDTGILTARLSPQVITPPPLVSAAPGISALSLSSPPQISLNRHKSALKPAPSASNFNSILPANLPPVINQPHTLLIDIRPPTAYSSTRLLSALSLSVPSTLLKRPNFTLAKLATMIPSSNTREKFNTWNTVARIIVYDADTSVLAEGNNVLGLLRKFQNEGFEGDLGWVKGGFTAVWKQMRSLIDELPEGSALQRVNSDEALANVGPLLRTRDLPMAAFQQSSTTSASQRPHSGDNISPNIRVGSAGPSEHPPEDAAPPPTSTRNLPYNPFYNEIRQNIELSQGITERIPLRLPPSLADRQDDLPFEWLKDIAKKGSQSDGDEETEALAMQFYKIELAEQRRLMGIMDHHTKEGAAVSSNFPFSITAGLEKGEKNRYRSIWPFEHARVRLNANSADEGCDYVNASFVQPVGTTRRYIATQGPLEATYTDFWTLVWEQNTRVIVMLTQQREGNSDKCGTYWINEQYGPHIRLKLIDQEGESPPSDSDVIHRTAESQSFDFGMPSPKAKRNPMIRRTFLLTHLLHPEQPPRRVTHFQYLDWPDLNVPESPDDLLDLIQQANAAAVFNAADQGPGSEPGPVVLHCSAGVGRTGAYILVDAVLDGIKREMDKAKKKDGGALRAGSSHVGVQNFSSSNVRGASERLGSLLGSAIAEAPTSRQRVSPDSMDIDPPSRPIPIPSVPSTVGSSPERMNSPSSHAFPPALSSFTSMFTQPSVSMPSLRLASPTAAAAAMAQLASDATSTLNRQFPAQRLSHVPAAGVDSGGARPPGERLRPRKSSLPAPIVRDFASGFARANIIGIHGGQAAASAISVRDSRSGSSSSSAAVDTTLTTTSSSPSSQQPSSLFSNSASASALTKASSLSSRRHSMNISNLKLPTSPGDAGPEASSNINQPRMPQGDLDMSDSSQSNSRSGSYPPMPQGATGKASAPITALHPAFDYKTPRRLHQDGSPEPLSSFDEPILHVLDDMREQRMSLCQSLRQYVFAHQAILQGALQLVDNERTKEASCIPPLEEAPRTPPMKVTSIPISHPSPQKLIHSSLIPSVNISPFGRPLTPITPATGKRGPSPTELQKEGSTGEPVLAKRLSIKRRERSDSPAT